VIRNRRSFRGAMDFLQGKRSAQFPDADELEALRTLGEAVRQHALQNLPQLLEQLEQNLTRNGVQVHWARDAAEANQLVLQIAQRAAAKK
jgi:L-lactate dehydrogenase complex protein LldF